MTQNQLTDVQIGKIQSAPHNAIYIAGTESHAATVRMKAIELGREDITVQPATWLDRHTNYSTLHFTGIVLDPSAMLTTKQTYALVEARARVKRS